MNHSVTLRYAFSMMLTHSSVLSAEAEHSKRPLSPVGSKSSTTTCTHQNVSRTGAFGVHQAGARRKSSFLQQTLPGRWTFVQKGLLCRWFDHVYCKESDNKASHPSSHSCTNSTDTLKRENHKLERAPVMSYVIGVLNISNGPYKY